MGDILLNAHGKRVEIGSKWTHPDWKYYLLALKQLCIYCYPVSNPANNSTSNSDPTLLHPPSLKSHSDPETGMEVKGYELSGLENELLYSKVFLERLVTEASSKSRGKAVCELVTHVCTNNPELSQRLIAYITIAIDSLPYDKLRP